MLAWLANLLTGGLFGKALDFASNMWSGYLAAKNNTERIQADVAQTDIVARQAIVTAEVNSSILAWPRFVIETTAAAYFFECVFLDKVVASILMKFGHRVDCGTDDITGSLGTTYSIVIGAMFGASIADRIVSKLTNK